MTKVFLLTCLTLTAGLANPNWDKLRLSVTPGVGTTDFQLGADLPEKWPVNLGAPTLEFPFQGTGEGLKRLIWGSSKKGQLDQGMAILVLGLADERAIIDIEIKRIRAGVDGENLFLGLPEETISKRSELVQKDGRTSYILPGLTIETEKGKMIGLLVHSPSSTRWRFQRWAIRPGKAAGPVRLGEVLDETLYQQIGEPHEKSRESLVWKAADSDQSLKIMLDPKRRVVTRVRGVGLPWRTPNGITVGDSKSAFLSKHKEAKEGLGRQNNELVLKLPGFRATFVEEKLASFDIYP